MSVEEISKLKADLTKFLLDFQNHKEDVKNLFEEYLQIKSLLATIREEFARNLTSTHSSLLKIIEDKVKILPDLLKSHKIHQSILDEFSQKIESISLDSRNAVLRANNNEIVTQINRKKIENIQLILKNYELNK